MRTLGPEVRMEPVGWHIMMRLEVDQVIAPSPAARRAWALAVRRLGEARRVFVFDAADTHGHVGAACDRAAAGRLAHDIEVAVGRGLGRFRPAHLVPIRDQWHLDNVFGYVLRQDERHGLLSDPSREASALPDLLGLRVGAGPFVRVVRELLPRLRRDRLLEALGVDELPLGSDPAWLAESAAAAVGVAALDGRELPVLAARRAAMRVGLELGLRKGEVGRLLGTSARTVTRLAESEADAALVRAIRLQMGLREKLAAARPDAFADRPQRAVSV